jgi:hypothetical protein
MFPLKQGSESPQHLTTFAFSEPQLLFAHTNIFFSEQHPKKTAMFGLFRDS